MKTKRVYIVTYNDCYGNGTDKRNESVLEKESDFKKWLKAHNKQRKLDGNEPESKEEFDVTPIDMVISFDK